MTATHDPAVAPRLSLDFFSDAALADPVPQYHQMLAAGPVVWLDRLQMFAVCGHAALSDCLRRHGDFVSGRGVSINDDINRLIVGSSLNSDPPQHDRTRALTFAPLTPKALRAVHQRIEAAAVEIAQKVADMGTFDAAADLAPHVPLSVVRDLVGLGDHGKANMLAWGAATFDLMGDPRERRDAAMDSMRALRAFLEDEAVLSSLAPDGWARSATERGLAAGLPADRAPELMRDYIAPSLDTTISAIGYAIHLFARHPREWDKLRADRTRVRNAIEEVVRLNTPIRAFTRVAATDTHAAGVPIPGGSRVLMVFGAGNRDQTRFPEPDRFDIGRATRGHLGFGHGVHACLGMHLARLEMTCLLNALADRIARFEPRGQPTTARNAIIHAFARVPVAAVAG